MEWVERMEWFNWVGLYVAVAVFLIVLAAACGCLFGDNSDTDSDDLEF